MATVDWSPFDPNLAPGIYLAEVDRCEEKRSRAGDTMFEIRLRAVDFMRDLCMDWLLVEGPARNIGQGKLKALGFTGSEASIESSDIIGRRCYVNVELNSYENKKGETRTNLRPTKCDGASLGYFPENAPPSNVTKPPTEDVPF